MKRCPSCSQTFADDNVFCPDDGASLIMPVEQETVMMRRESVPGPLAATGNIPWATFGFILFLSVIAAGFGVAYFMSQPNRDGENPDTESTRVGSSSTPAPAPPTPDTRLIQENERLRAELERNRRSQSAPPPVTVGRTAYVPRPVTNIREGPTTQSRIQCRITSSGQYFRVFGSSGVSDNNGIWYHTDACGRQGFIHSTQFRYQN